MNDHLNLLDKKGEPYFEDGNIFLATEEPVHLFKLHRGVLARHSEIFQSMFTMPQPATDVDTLEGCQLVLMHDLPLELSNLVKALYDGPTFGNKSSEDFFYLAGILRISTKYFINNLRMRCIQFLTQTWACDLSGHDAMVQLALDAPLHKGASFPYVHPLHVLNLARETNVKIILPSIVYFLSIYFMEDILRGDHPKLQINHPSRPSSQISDQDVKIYTLMYQFRLSLILEFIHQFVGKRQRSEGCKTVLDQKQECSRGFGRLTYTLSRSWSLRTGIFRFMLQALDEMNAEKIICSVCRESFRKDLFIYRQAAWDRLPDVIGLPSWDVLRDIDSLAEPSQG